MLKRVLTGTILGLVLFVLGSATMDQVLERQARQYESLIDLFFPLREKVDEMHLLLLQQQSIIEQTVLDDGPPAAELEEASARFDDALAACFEVCFAMLRRPDGGLVPEAGELLADLERIHLSFEDHSRQLELLFDHLGSGRPAAAMAEQAGREATALQESVARFEEKLEARYAEALARASTVRSSVRRLFFAMVAAAIVLGTLANVYFYRSLVPIKSMVEAVRGITRGHYEVRVPAEGADEVSFLAGEFNAMAQALGEQREAILRSQEVIRATFDEKLQLERMVRQSEKLSAVGELSLGIAHEVRNPLSTIQMTLNSLAKRQDLSRSESERVALALNEVDRLEGLVSSLLDYGRPSAPRMAEVDVAATIARAIDLVEAECGRCGVAVAVAAAESELPRIEADANQVIQVLVNLLLNALQASPAGEKVRVSAGPDAGGETVSIRIADHGTGIDPQELKRVFTPFFTTRRDGTGLGLPVARKIAEAHGGELTVESTPGRGTSAVLKLPVRQIGPRRL